jgi:SET domain-containing protein
MPLVPGLRVFRSPIDGYGVIATRAFAPGEVIAEVEGVKWHVDQDLDDRYSLLVTNDIFFDMVDQTRWINHSCDPNASIDCGFTDDGEVWARIYAERPIQAGEEIHYDYAFSLEVAEPCRCGAARCRGWIIDEDELPALLAREAPAAVAG